MKKLLASCTLALWATVSTFAQTTERVQKTPEEKATHQTQKLTKELTLSADQSSKVKSVLLQEHQDIVAIKNKYASATDKSAMKQEIQAVRAKEDTQLKELLTADQYSKYQTVKAEHKKHNEGKGHQHN